MRGCCVSLAGLCALTLALAAPGALGGQPQPPPPPPQLVKKATWEETVKTVPDWYWRNYALGVPAVKKLREFFPEEKAKFYDLVRRVVLDGGGEDRMRFWLVGQAMSLDPQGADRAGLSLALASLQAAFLSPSLGGETLRGVDAKLLNEKDRKLLADLTARCKEWQYDILATGRSYEAERLIREAQEMAERKEFREAAVRLIKVATGHPNGYLPQENGVILGTGVYARAQLAAMAREHLREVTEAVEAQSPGLARRAEAGDRAALERLATAFPFTAQGAGALLRLGEEHLDANRPRLAALCFDRLVQDAPDGPLRAEALWRLATAWSLAGESARAEQALTALAGLKDVKLRLGSRECTAAQAAELVRKEFEATPGAAGSAAPEPGATLKPRLVFSYRPALFDLRNRCSVWPRFWARPESLAAIEGDRAFFHDSANLWALDWRQGALLWHYRSPGYLYELAHRERSFSNQIDEAWQSSRGYRVGVCGERVCARFRRPGQNLWYELRGLATGDGRLLWSTEGNPDLEGLSFASDPVGACDRFYVLAFAPEHISAAFVACLDPASGSVLWKSPVASGVDAYKTSLGNFFAAHGGLTVEGGRVYLSTDRGSFVALDALDGSLLWVSGCDRVFNRHSYWGLNDHDTRADRNAMIERSHAPPLIGAGAACFLSKDHPGLFGLEAATGRKLFVELPRTCVEVLGEFAGVAVAASRQELFGLETAAGRLAWELERPLSGRDPWRSGTLAGGRIYWPSGDEILVLSAKDGTALGRIKVESPVPPASLRLLPTGEFAAFASSGATDSFMVLSARADREVRLCEETPGLATDPATLVQRDAAPAEPPKAPAAAGRPAPLPPVELMWRSRFSPEELFTGSYVVEVLGAPPHLLAAAGTELRCHRFDTEGALLWCAPTPPSPQELQLWSGGRVCLRWANGIEIFDLNSGRRLGGWCADGRGGAGQVVGGVWGTAELDRDTVLVWTRENFQATRLSSGEKLWTRQVANNAWGLSGAGTPWGALTAVRQDQDYGGSSYLELLDPASGKVKWRKDLPKNTHSLIRGRLVWTAATNYSRVGLVEPGPEGARDVWSRDVGASEWVEFEGDRLLVVKKQSVLVLDSMTGKDVLPALATGGGFVSGPRVYTFQGPGQGYGQAAVQALDRASGKLLWNRNMGHGNPPRSTAEQVLVPGGVFNGGYYWSHVIRAYLGSLHSLDLATGESLGRWAIPGRNLWDVDDGRGHLAVSARDNLIVLRSEQGPVVLGSAALRPAMGAAAERLGQLDKAERSPAEERELATLRESRMRHHRPFLGCEKVETAPFLDGEIDDWAGAAWTELDRAADFIPADGGALAPGAKRWAGPADCSARFAARHDGQTLYLAVEVRDDDFSPPVGRSFLTPGDSVEVGVSLGGPRVDALTLDVDSWHPDIKVVLALVGGRPEAQPVWFGSGSEAAISVRPGLVRYEAAIPFRSGRTWPASPAQLGLALRVNDADGGRPKGAMCWAGGLGAVNASAEFGSLMLAPLSRRDIAERRRVADLLPDAALAWDLLRGIAETHLALDGPAPAVGELQGFLERHPQSYHASKCLAWCEQLLARSPGADAAGKVRALAERLKIPALEQEEARTRIFARAKLVPGRHPRCLGLSFSMKSHRWQERLARGVYWGEPRGPMDGGLIYAGPLPAGEDLDLSVPAELLELANKTVESVSFLQLDGQAFWGDLGVAEPAGARKIWVEATAKGAGRDANWRVGKAPDGSPAHAPADFGIEWTAHVFQFPKGLALANANAKLEAEGGRLDKTRCLEAAALMPEDRLAAEILDAVGDPEEVAAFIRRFPASPLVPGLLRWLAERANRAALAEQIIAEGKLSREACRAYYARLPGIEAWQVVGPFSNEADVALRRDCGPEARPELAVVYRGAEAELRWQEVKAERSQVDLGKLLAAGNFQAAYAMVWVRAPQARRAWVFIESPNVVSLWNGRERILENASSDRPGPRGRQGGALDPVPMTLEAGWNRILVKDCGRWGYWGFKLRLGAADGAPLQGLEYGTKEPPAVPKE